MKIKPFKLERFYSIYEFTAKYMLSSSDCESMSIGEVLALEEGAAEKFQNHWLGYTETQGNPLLREEITNIYTTMLASDIFVGAGGEEPIYLFIQSMLEAGDEVIIQYPCYQSVHSIPESIGCRISLWNVSYENAKPYFDIEELEKLITPKTKVIFLNTPHNPTGYHFSKDEQQKLIELARKNEIIIFGDEVYRELEHAPQYKIPAFADVYENAVSLGVMTKAYGLAGLKIGWLATKRTDILEKVAILRDYTTICNSAPSEFLAMVALRNREKIVNRNLHIVQNNLPILNSFFSKYGDLFSWQQPIAGPISFVKLNFGEDSLAFAEEVVNKKGVLLLPGEVYDYPGFFRLGFARKNMSEALEKFEEFIVQELKVKG